MPIMHLAQALAPSWLWFSLTSALLGRQTRPGPSSGWSPPSGGCRRCRRASCAGPWRAGHSGSCPPRAVWLSCPSPFLE